MSHYFTDDECDKCINYVKVISNDKAWSCHICGINELEIEYSTKYNKKMIWHRYQLQCGDEVHPRCYKRWCKEYNTVGCSRHLTLDCKEYCNHCRNFDHNSLSCPVMQHFTVREYSMVLWNNIHKPL